MSSEKYYQRSIRIGMKLIRSPRFKTKREADEWYGLKKHERDQTYNTYEVKLDDKTILSVYFDSTWYPKRVEKYGAATHLADKQRFDKYVRKTIGHLVVSKINTHQIKRCLDDVVDVEKKSTKTRNKVRSLLSKLFSDAMFEKKGSLCKINPARGITFQDPREGKKDPSFLSKKTDIVAYMKSAKALGSNHFLFAALGMMSGLRKSEIIGLQWGDIDFDECRLRVSRRFGQAAKKILNGTKAGSNEGRDVPIPDELVKILSKIRDKSDFQENTDFVLATQDGECVQPRKLATISEQISKLSGVYATPHTLRHTYGREFAIRSGNIKALQAILGHSNSNVTDLYSKLAGKHLSKVRNKVSFKVDDDENG